MRIKLFTFSLLSAIVFCWGINNIGFGMEHIFADLDISQNSGVLLANAGMVSKPKTPKPDLTAKAVVSVLFNKGNSKIVFEKNADEKLPIASLTKLMTADVALDNYYRLTDIVAIKDELKPSQSSGYLKVGETFSVQELIYAMLVGSDNDAAVALSDVLGQQPFVDLMNLEAKYIGMNNTVYYNMTGLDSDDELNLSTSNDLVKLAKHIISLNSAKEFLAQKSYTITLSNGELHHIAQTTNDLLNEDNPFGNKKIIAGKTGETIKAKGCLLIALENPKTGAVLINVVLGSDDRFGETKKVIEWVNTNYNW